MKKQLLDGGLISQLEKKGLIEMPEKLIAVSRIFAKARKEMTLNEQKAFVYALTQIKFTEKMEKKYVNLDKKVLARIMNNHSDTDHLSQNLYDELKYMPEHSMIELSKDEIGFKTRGFLITSVSKFKNVIRLTFNNDYIPLFSNLNENYITMWSSDIFQMTGKRSVQFYEFLREITDTRDSVNTLEIGVKALKEMFNIPKEGKGSYMREKGGFNRTEFEHRVIDPICEDLKGCKMIRLIEQPNDKLYEKIKQGNRVVGYRFDWNFSKYPAVADANEVREIQDRVDSNPQILKIAKDILTGEKKRIKKASNDFESRKYDMDELEKILLRKTLQT